MRMQEAMAALGSGQVVDARHIVGGATRSPADRSGGGAKSEDRSERSVSLG